MYVGTILKGKGDAQSSFGLVPISTQFQRIIFVPSGGSVAFALVEEMVEHFAGLIFGKNTVQSRGTIDDVTDSIEDVLLRLYMFNIRTLRPEAQAFAQVIADCCAALKTMMEEFPNFRRSKTIHTQIVEINGLEEQGDKLYTDAMHTLYADASTPVDVMAWTALFDRLEKCCDKCEDVADVVERVILKNS